MKHGKTPVMIAAQCSKSPDVVGALMNAKANLEVTSPVRHLEDNRCAPYMCSLATRVFIEGRHDSSDVGCGIL